MTSSFGTKLKALRTQNGITLKAVADELDVSIVYVSDIERGRRNPPSDSKIAKMAEIVKGSVDELLNLAARDRNKVELSLDSNQAEIFSDTALALARRWDSMTEDDAYEIFKILTKGKQNEQE